ncbi:MAG: hypothetical protein H0V81_10190 [Solirubrobacterales bacterium]|nr:hypothetical protein [Solirubrobacterales bacterium]
MTATAALALPAAALADAPSTTKGPSSAKQCKTLRTQMGADAFKAAYGTNTSKSNAFGKCVSALSKAAKAERASTVDGCRAERAADAAAFAAKYGTGKKQANAFGKCVSASAKKDAAEVRSDQRSAVKSCRQERGEDANAFSAKYGTNANKRNAFGKCVSKAAKAKAEDRDDAAEAANNDTPQNDTNPGQSKKQSS